MMAASSSFKGASAGRSDDSLRRNSSQEAKHSTNDATDDDFGSFAAAELLSDPFGDVYGAEADFGDFVGQTQSNDSSPNVDSSSLMAFSPLMASKTPTAPPTLIPSISSEVDPFADITGGLGAATDDTKGITHDSTNATRIERQTTTTPRATAPTSTSAILDLVWGKTAQESESSQLSMSLKPGKNSVDGQSRKTSSPNTSVGFLSLTKYATFPKSGPSGAVNGDLLSFSPVHASTPSDPFFGLSTDCIETNLPPLELGNGAFTLTTTPPQSTTSMSAPTSMRGSIVSLYDEVEPSVASLGVQEKAVKRTTRSSRSLSSSSFVSVGAIDDSIGHLGMHASFGAFASAAHDAVTGASPSSAPPSLHSSFASSRGFGGFTTSASYDSDDLDPFAEAGLAASEEIPLAKALAAWNTTVETEELSKEKTKTQADELKMESSHDDVIEGSDSVQHEWNSWKCGDEMKSAVTDCLTPGVATSTEMAAVTRATASFIAKDKHNEPDAIRLQDEENESESKECGVSIVLSDKGVCSSGKQSTAESNTESLEMNPLTTLATSDSAESGGGSDVPSLHFNSFGASPSVSDFHLAETSIRSGNINKNSKAIPPKNDMQDLMNNADIDDYGDIEGLEPQVVQAGSDLTALDASPWGSSLLSTPVQNKHVEEDSKEPLSDVSGTFTDDGFANFEQAVDEEDFGDFGDFTQTSGTNGEGFTDFQQFDSQNFGTDDDDFGEFAPAVAPPSEVQAMSLSASSFSKTEVVSFFKKAFATEPIPSSSKAQSYRQDEVDTVDEGHDLSTETVRDVFRNMWDEYISIVVSTGRQSASSSASLSSSSGISTCQERVRLDRKTARASKYLKYVLSEKIQEASRQNGIFPHGSERHAMYVGYAASGDADRMRAALKELHEALFHSSVNEAMMRIAKQAALSAKAKIAEQAAQHASSRGGSLFSTTRQLLSRGGSTSGAHGPGSGGNDNKSDHAGADTPTGASVQKFARFSVATSQDDTANGPRSALTGEERGSEGSDHTGHSSGSDSEAAGDSRTRSQILSSTNGGLMRKFQDRFSFTGARHRPRFVNLRRQGQSSEEVRKMELNLDAINGGLDEVKWKCAMFLYDVKEVAHVAPSQIIIASYPSMQPLTGKTDRSALTKLVKPHTVWTVDIGANNSDILNEW